MWIITLVFCLVIVDATNGESTCSQICTSLRPKLHDCPGSPRAFLPPGVEFAMHVDRN